MWEVAIVTINPFLGGLFYERHANVPIMPPAFSPWNPKLFDFLRFRQPYLIAFSADRENRIRKLAPRQRPKGSVPQQKV